MHFKTLRSLMIKPLNQKYREAIFLLIEHATDMALLWLS